MSFIPQNVASVFGIFAPCFSEPTFERVVTLALSAILTTGTRTVSNLVRTIESLTEGHPTTYHHVFSKRRWRCWQLSRVLVTFLIARFVPVGTIHLAGDDTTAAHPGREVFGKGRHRDAARSSHSFTAWIYGHKWVVLHLVVKFPFASRPWALPIMAALYTTPEWDKAHERRHRTSPEIMEGLIAAVLHWFPKRCFIFSGDGAFGTHRLSRFASRNCRGRLTLVSRFYADAALYETPPPSRPGKKGRPRVKGNKLLTPKQIVQHARRTPLTVNWYGGETRHIEVVSGIGHWYKSGEGLVLIRWVFVHDLDGTHRDEYFFTTDVELTPTAIVEEYTGRWSCETTYQECKNLLGLGSTRCRKDNSVLREVPCLFALYSLIMVIYASLNPDGKRSFIFDWPGKKDVSFSDALATVRRFLWREGIFQHADKSRAFEKTSSEFQDLLLHFLAPAA
jgi:hypothetical protein